jgi:multiple sugar transport system permease protein
MDRTTTRVAPLSRLLAGVRVRPGREAGTGPEGYLYLAPALLILVVFVVVPAIWVLVLSFYRWDLISSDATFIALGNYLRMWNDPLWWKSLWQTCYFVAVTVPVGMLIALGLAMLLNAPLRGRGLLRSAIFSPYITPSVATIVIWEWIFNKDYGLLNGALAAVHLPAVEWLNSPSWIMPSVIIYSLWAFTGFNVVIFLAGLSNIPRELEDAARVDGAGPWQVFWNVTWPLLSPTTYFVLLISTIGSFKVFNVVFVLTSGNGGVSGGPDRAAMTIGVYLYKQAFEFFRAGYASAISVALFAIILTLTLIQMRVAARRVFYQ